MSIEKGICKGCGQPIFWVKTAKTNKPQPLDVKTEKRIILNKDGRAQVVDTYIPHHATCPEVEKFR